LDDHGTAQLSPFSAMSILATVRVLSQIRVPFSNPRFIHQLVDGNTSVCYQVSTIYVLTVCRTADTPLPENSVSISTLNSKLLGPGNHLDLSFRKTFFLTFVASQHCGRPPDRI
jgi:hypothetical protein